MLNKILYFIVQKIVRLGLFCYYKEIQIHGLEKVPKDKPVIFLANHQNALLDPLIIAACTDLKPYFLTRSDIFVNIIFNRIFSFLRMLPIYRMQDGRNTLGKNVAIFERCTQLLRKHEPILLFPEANHNIQRRVRPLSKGFTRIIFNAYEQDPAIDIQLVPVGINYEAAAKFPDRVAFYFGNPVGSRQYYDISNPLGSTMALKNKIAKDLKQLTVHIEALDHYDEITTQLDRLKVNYLKPGGVNKIIANFKVPNNPLINLESKRKNKNFFDYVFMILNAPILLIWSVVFKSKIEEVEFLSTFRFAFAFIMMPIFYVVLWLVSNLFFADTTSFLILFTHFAFNLAYVKLR
jgi:1-acyl-sn-glycerol-3-phosphate acyltransferase